MSVFVLVFAVFVLVFSGTILYYVCVLFSYVCSNVRLAPKMSPGFRSTQIINYRKYIISYRAVHHYKALQNSLVTTATYGDDLKYNR